MMSLDSDSQHYNYNRHTIVRLGGPAAIPSRKKTFPDAITGSTLNLTLPSYDTCGTPCQDGIYVALSIHVPFNATRRDVCLGVITDEHGSSKTTTDKDALYAQRCGLTVTPADVRPKAAVSGS